MAVALSGSPSRLTSEHRVLVIARDRQRGIAIADTLAAEGMEVRGPVSTDDFSTSLQNYSARGIPVCALVVDYESNVALTVIHAARSLAGVECIVVGRDASSEDAALLLDAGAADFARSETATIELAARVRRCVAAAAASAGATLPAGRLRIDVARREVRDGAQLVNLTRTEFDVLACLARHANRVVPASDILHEALGYARDSDTHVLTVHVQRLRTKVERDPRNPTLITSVRGIGYMLVND